MLRYQVPSGVKPLSVDTNIHLTTPQGGRVAIDRAVLDLFQIAHNRRLDEIVAEFKPPYSTATQVKAGLACLVEAGLLERADRQLEPLPELTLTGDLVSVVIVCYNSLSWLETCLDSLHNQTYSPLEIILVDNASQDDSTTWVESHHPDVQLLRLSQTLPLARAINFGIDAASGRYYLLLNPDVELKLDAVAQLVEIARQNPSCAAVASKLRLLWTPAFLNGMGNLVGAISWGTDIGLGALDLGQFDAWDKSPSACFAGALISAKAMRSVGPLDEGFPMYYEDSEWCYRARLFGYTVHSAPQAVIYHAYSSRVPDQDSAAISSIKLRRVTHGRLRFITRINGAGYFWSFFLNYLLEDLIRFLGLLLRFHWDRAGAVPGGWLDFLRSLPGLLVQRKQIQSRRSISDQSLYHLQRSTPPPRMHGSVPQLNWDAVCSDYLPSILTGQTRSLPEFETQGDRSLSVVPHRWSWERVQRIMRIEGLGVLVFRLAKEIQWKWMQP
jgi:GT2 family glycosyltransferase